APTEGGRQTGALYPNRTLHSQQLQQRRQQVDDPRLLLYPQTRGNGSTRQQERNAKRRIVQKDSVSVLAVLRKALAVVGQHRDERVAGRRLLAYGIEEPSHLLVGIGDLTVIRPIGVLFPKRGRRIVRNMRIVHVYPQKERLPRLLVEP